MHPIKDVTAGGKKRWRTEPRDDSVFQLSLRERRRGPSIIYKPTKGIITPTLATWALKATCQLLFISGGANVSMSERWAGTIYPIESDIRKILSDLLCPLKRGTGG